jgi:peptidoglycan DL-endopeptidase LytE
MKKVPGFIVLCFFVLFFVAFPADSALARKARSKGLAHKVSDKHQPRVANKGNAAAKTSKQTITSAKRSSHVKKAHAASGKRTKTAAAKTAMPEIEEAVLYDKDDDEYIKYRVRNGETLERVAERFNVDKEEIVDLNQFKKKGLKPGSVVFIPKTNEGLDVEAPIVLNDRPLTPWKNAEEQGILVKVAKSFAGAPYKYGGDTVRGLDCSAFVRKMYEIFEVQLPRSARDQYCAGPRVDRNDLVTGDLVFFKTNKFANYPTHVGIYIGDDKFIHASSLLSRGVKIDRLSEGYFSKTYTGAVRVKAPPATNKSQTEHDINRASDNS